MSRMPCRSASNASVPRFKRTSPNGVGETPRGPRSSRRTPSAASRSATACEMAGCVRPRCTAAFAMLPKRRTTPRLKLTLTALVAAACLGPTATRGLQAQSHPIAPAYVVNEIEVTDPAGFASYAAREGALIERFGGKFLARSGKADSVAGALPQRITIYVFDSMAKAQAGVTRRSRRISPRSATRCRNSVPSLSKAARTARRLRAEPDMVATGCADGRPVVSNHRKAVS